MITNQLILEINKEKIEQDYDIFIITTSNKYFENGVKFLDDMDVLSTYFDGKKSCYTLSKKGKIDKSALFEMIKRDDVRIDFINYNTIEDYVIFNIFLRSLGKNDFSNVGGKFFACHPSTFSKNKKQFDALEIDLDKNYLLNLLARKFTLKSAFKNQRKIASKPMYELNGRILKRVYKESEKTFIKKPFNNEKGNIKFLEFSDINKYEASKVGILYDVLEKFSANFSKYFKYELKEIKLDGTKRTSLSQRNAQKDTFINKADGKIRIVSFVELSEFLLDKISEIFLELNCRYELTKEPSADALNIILVKPKEYYDGDDPYSHQKEIIKQHLSVESCDDINKDKIRVCIQELIIKNDIKKRQITFFDSEFKKLSFIMPIFNTQKELCNVIKMEVLDDRNFNINDLSTTKSMRYAKYLTPDILGLIENNKGDINIVEGSDMIALPSKNFHNILKDKEKNPKFEVKMLLELAKTCSSKQASQLISWLEKQSDCSANMLRNFFCANSLKGIKTQFNKVLYQKTGFSLLASAKYKEALDEFFSGIFDINYTKTKNNDIFYTAGVYGLGVDKAPYTATHIKLLRSVNDSELLFDQILPYLNVFFIRTSGITIIPFTFKYMREYAKMLEF